MPDKNPHQEPNLEERFRAILEQSPLSIQIMSSDGRIVQVNKAWEQLWGVTLEQIEGYNILEDEQLVKKGAMPYVKRGFAGESAEIPPILYDPNDTLPDVTKNSEPQRWTKSIIYPIKDASGRVKEVVLMHEDITIQKRAETALRESEMRYRGLLENANDIIYSHDLEGRYLSINSAGEKITGYTREEVLEGMNFSQIIVPEHLETARRMIARKIENPEPTVYELDIIAKDGRRLTLEISSRISFDGGVPTTVEGVARDVTERKRVEEEKARLAKLLANQQKHLQEMVSSVPGVVWEAWGEPDVASQRMNFVSAYVETMLGYSVEEWLSTPNFWLTIVHPEDKEAAARVATETFSSCGAGVNRFRWIRKDGRAVWVETQSVTICDEEGNPVGMRGVTMDITERKQKEANEKFLAEASTALSSSLDYETTLATVANLSVPHFADWCSIDIADENGKLRRLAVAHIDPEKVAWARDIHKRFPPDESAVQGAYNVLRTGKSEFYPQITDEMLVSGAQNEEHLKIMREIGFRSAMVVPLKTRDKTLGVITFVNTGSRAHSRDDLILAENLAARAALAVDNAHLFRAEQLTRRNAERTSDFLARLQKISTSLSQALTPQEVALAVIEQGVNSLGAYSGSVILLDEAKEELEIVGSYGLPEKVVEKWRRFSVNENVPVADAVRLKAPVLIESLTEYEEKYPHLLLESSLKRQSSAAFPLIVEGRSIGAIGLSFAEARKFTEDDRAFIAALTHQCAQALERARRYETEQRLRTQAETANRMKDEFLATVSHELRTPLTAIVGWSSLLAASKLEPETTARAIETIKRNATAQTQIIEDLLEVSRIITGKLRLNLDWVKLDETIKTALESLRPAIETKNIALKIDIEPLGEMFWGDADRLQQVMWNLLSNAIKFTPNGGEIRVSLKLRDNRIQIKVKDTGEGISREFLPFVFERFTQADGTASRKYGGLGLGLAIARHLVEMHGGTIRAESAGLNQGTTFILDLPVQRQTETIEPDEENFPPRNAAPENDAAPSPNFENLRVLIVDDEADARFLLKTIIENCGATVETSGSAAEALEAVTKFKPQVLISDIGMPDEDGYSLIGKIRNLPDEDGGNVRAVALTAYARAEDKEKAKAAGFQLHVAKPVNPGELIEAVLSLTETQN